MRHAGGRPPLRHRDFVTVSIRSSWYVANPTQSSGRGRSPLWACGGIARCPATIQCMTEHASVAIVATEIDLMADPAGSDWVIDRLDADVRLRVETSQKDVFIGIAPDNDVDRYLSGVAHNELLDLDDDMNALYRNHPGSSVIAPPIDQSFWTESAVGPTPTTLDWRLESGNWSVVLMNADGSPGVLADVNVGARADFVLPLAIILMVVGALLTPAALALILFGTAGSRTPDPHAPNHDALPVAGVGDTFTIIDTAHPVALQASLDPHLSHWKWLIKWILAIPHFIAVCFLWAAFVVLTAAAGVAILFTGRYPRAIFDFNVGVLRWTWRVSYYATAGGLGTDRYPPFSLDRRPGDLATLDIIYPERLSRGLVLVKWWLLAIPHYIIVTLLIGDVGWANTDGPNYGRFSLLGVLAFVAGLSLLFTGKYPRPLFDLIVGLNRWIYRVVAYAALMTDTYPPFRLDQGGTEPTSDPLVGTDQAPSTGMPIRYPADTPRKP